MKVIGKAGELMFLFSVSDSEVNMLLGDRYGGQQTLRKKRQRDLRIGDEIQIAEMYESLSRLDGFEREALDIEKRLTSLAASVRKIAPLVKAEVPVKITRE